MMLSARHALRTAARTVRVPVTSAARTVASSAKASATAASAWERGLVAAGTAGLAFGIIALNTETAHAFSGKVDWEGAVRKDIIKLIEDEEKRRNDGTGIGPTLIRLAWHSSGTYDCKAKNGGSNGATMRFCPEGNWGANQGLCVARRLLEPIQAKHGCTFADLWTFAGKVAVEEAGGPMIPWRAGRTDADDGSKTVPDGRLPDATQGAAHIRDVFYRMGFDDKEIVALSGAHSMGFTHLDNSGFVGPWSFAPNSFSNEYFRLLVEEKWVPKKMHKGKPWKGPLQYEDSTGKLMMLPTDMALMEDPEFKKYVLAYKEDEQLFFKDFAAAFGKLMELGCPFPGAAGGGAGGAGIIGQIKEMIGLKA